MDKYIPYKKLSKKEKRKLDSAKAYNHKKIQNWKEALPGSASSFYCLFPHFSLY